MLAGLRPMSSVRVQNASKDYLDHPTSGRVLIDDETNLDSRTGEAIVSLMEEMNRREGTTFIFSTHDPRVMGRAHRVLRLEDGRFEA
jgi:putative ABC transport system ATP-binding protein